MDKMTREEVEQLVEDYRYADAELRKALRKSEQRASDLAQACRNLTRALEIYQRMVDADDSQ